MSSELDPAKLKVVELRAELTSRGLDAKGNKAALVKRLKDALEQELQKELPDTSIADTSTEDLNISQTEEAADEQDKDVEMSPPPSDTKKEEEKPKVQENKKTKDDEVIDKKDERKTESPEKKATDTSDEPVQKKPKIESPPGKTKSHDVIEKKKSEKSEDVKATVESNREITSKKDDMPASEENIEEESEEGHNVEENGEGMETVDEDSVNKKSQEADTEEDMEVSADKNKASSTEKKEETRGDKRKRSPSPTRSQRRRSRSPIKEDEPPIDTSKAQLNWYDSDLHLQIDKESFLTGRPYHDGAFGYVWSGVRATHGANSGKVCYEVKITEELKWEDIIKQPDRGRRDRDRRDSRRDRSEKRERSFDRRKSGDKKDSRHRGRDDKKDTKSENKEEKADTKSENKEDAKKEETTSDKEEKQDEDENSKAKEIDETQTKEKDKIEEETKDEMTEKVEEKKEETSAQDTKMETDQPETSEQKEDNSDETMDVDENKDIKTEDVDENKVDNERGEEKKEISEENKELKEEKKDTKDDKKDVKEGKKDSKEEKEKEIIPPIPTHLIRIGWSSINCGLQLGESAFSYGFESSGKFVTDKQFSDYGKPFALGDVIGAYLEFSDETINIKYTINGEELPVATTISKADITEENFTLFPHVLSRNYAFEVNLGNKEEPFFKQPESLEDFIYIDKLESKVLGPVRPETRNECEVIMMCGLPASGKTHWVKEHVSNNLDKRYTIIGNSQLLDKMTVNGMPLKNSLKSRWNVVVDKLSKCLNKLVEVAALRRRNYVIDQTNVFPSAQRRKMRPFEGFKRRAVIVVCGEEEQARRRALQEAQDGKDVSNIAVYEMKAIMSLPKVGDWLEEVTYVELDEQEAKTVVQKYNKEGRENGFGPLNQRRDYRDDRRWHQNRRNDYRGGYRDRHYPPSRFDRGKRSGGWESRSSGNWGRNDRRDRGSSGRPRDYRNNRGSSQRHDRGPDRNRHGSRDNYSRSRNQGSSRSQSGTWQSGSGGSGGSWSQGSNYSSSQGSWQGQSTGGAWSQNYGTSGAGKWNYGAQGSQGGYGGQQQNYGNYPNWNYYGQYQNWNAQVEPTTNNWSK